MTHSGAARAVGAHVTHVWISHVTHIHGSCHIQGRWHTHMPSHLNTGGMHPVRNMEWHRLVGPWKTRLFQKKIHATHEWEVCRCIFTFPPPKPGKNAAKKKLHELKWTGLPTKMRTDTITCLTLIRVTRLWFIRVTRLFLIFHVMRPVLCFTRVTWLIENEVLNHSVTCLIQRQLRVVCRIFWSLLVQLIPCTAHIFNFDGTVCDVKKFVTNSLILATPETIMTPVFNFDGTVCDGRKFVTKPHIMAENTYCGCTWLHNGCCLFQPTPSKPTDQKCSDQTRGIFEQARGKHKLSGCWHGKSCVCGGGREGGSHGYVFGLVWEIKKRSHGACYEQWFTMPAPKE